MKDRKKQRENRKLKEEKLNIRDYTGVLNPTPYYAVLNMRNGNNYPQKAERKEVTRSGK